jgi:DNA-binding transcriptional ArsR family regulator
MRDIATKTKIKRPTIYLHIEELTAHRLVHLMRVGKRTHYVAAHPSLLIKLAERTTASLQDCLPQLTQLYDTTHRSASDTRLLPQEVDTAIALEITETEHLYVWSSDDFYKKEFLPHFAVPKNVSVIHLPTNETTDRNSPILIFDHVTIFLHPTLNGFSADRIIGREVATRMRQLIDLQQK